MPTHRQCPHCVRQFTRTEHLARHIRSHTKEKPFNCVACGKSYVREDTLIRHAKSHGTEALQRASKASADLCERNSARGLPISPSESSPGGEIHMSSSYSAPTEVEVPQETSDHNSYAPSTDELPVFGISDAPQVAISGSSATGGHRRQSMDLSVNQDRPWDFWNAPFVEDFSTWPMNGAFSMDAVDMVPGGTHMHDIPMQNHATLTNNFPIEEQSPSEFNLPKPVVNLASIWFTKLPGSDVQFHNSPPSPAATTPNDQRSDATVDDKYRLRLSKVFLTPPPQDNRLPSSDFMNLCVRMYFARFNPLFPIIHSATFRPTAENGLLLLSITSVGCLFLGSAAAVRRGKLIFERVNKAIIASRENILARRNDETLAMVQASMIGQTFALLSGDPGYLSTFETFHGSVISFARREKMFDAPAAIPHIENVTGPELESAWRFWVRREEIKRVCAGLRIHDGEISALLHYEPLLRSVASKPPGLSSDRMFSAGSSVEWASIVQDETTFGDMRYSGHDRQERIESFSEYVILEGYGTSIAEDRLHDRLDDVAINSYQEALLQWYQMHAQNDNEEQPGQLCLLMLWHWVYMSLLVDFDKLEQAIGRDGPEAASTAIDYVSTWVLSPNSTRCVLHALIPQRQCQSLRFDKVHALHLPRILFCAAVAWYCYLQYGPTESAAILFENIPSHFPEMGFLSATSQKHISEITRLSWRHGEMSTVKAMTLCEIGESLQRISHWGIASEFARIVSHLIYHDEHEATGQY